MFGEAEGSRGRGGVCVSGSFHIRNRGAVDEMVSGLAKKRGQDERASSGCNLEIFCVISSLVKVGRSQPRLRVILRKVRFI